MSETMTLEELRTYLSDLDPYDVAIINEALDAAIRERDRLRGDVSGMAKESGR